MNIMLHNNKLDYRNALYSPIVFSDVTCDECYAAVSRTACMSRVTFVSRVTLVSRVTARDTHNLHIYTKVTQHILLYVFILIALF